MNTLFWVVVFSQWGKVNPLSITTSDCDGSTRKVYIALFFRVHCGTAQVADYWSPPHAGPSRSSLNTFTWCPNVFRVTRPLGAMTRVCVWTMSGCCSSFSSSRRSFCHCCYLLSPSFRSTFLLLTFPFTLGLMYSVSFCG